MKRGPKPTPTDELNSWRAESDARKNEIKVARLAKCPAPLPWLNKRAEYYWKQIAPWLHEHKLIAAPDLAALALLCQRLADVERMGALTEGDELISTGDSVKANPLIKARDAAIADARRMFADLGMTPTARIGMPKVETPGGRVIDASGHFKKG